MNESSSQSATTQIGRLDIPHERRRIGSPFQHGMQVQVLGPDPHDGKRVLVSLDSDSRPLSLEKRFVSV